MSAKLSVCPSVSTLTNSSVLKLWGLILVYSLFYIPYITYIKIIKIKQLYPKLFLKFKFINL